MDKLKYNKKILYVGICCVVTVILGIIGFFIYNSSPSVQLRKQMDLGQKYLEEQNYDEAIIAFNQAIDIEPNNIQAYTYIVKAYILSDKNDELVSFYEDALSVVDGLDEDSLMQNMDYAVSLYLFVEDVYDDLDKIIDILEIGYTITEDEEIHALLIEKMKEREQLYIEETEAQQSVEPIIEEEINDNDGIADNVEEVSEAPEFEAFVDKAGNELAYFGYPVFNDATYLDVPSIGIRIKAGGEIYYGIAIPAYDEQMNAFLSEDRQWEDGGIIGTLLVDRVYRTMEDAQQGFPDSRIEIRNMPKLEVRQMVVENGFSYLDYLWFEDYE